MRIGNWYKFIFSVDENEMSPEKIRRLTTITADLILSAGIEIRDNWFGYDGNNYDFLEINNYDIKLSNMCDVQ